MKPEAFTFRSEQVSVEGLNNTRMTVQIWEMAEMSLSLLHEDAFSFSPVLVSFNGKKEENISLY